MTHEEWMLLRLEQRRYISYWAIQHLLLTPEQVMALPLRSCKMCGNLELRSGWCGHYGVKLPEPGRSCRCVEFVSWKQQGKR